MREQYFDKAFQSVLNRLSVEELLEMYDLAEIYPFLIKDGRIVGYYEE